MLLQQVPELQDAGRIRSRLSGQVDSDKFLWRLTVCNGVFDAFIRPFILLLYEAHPQQPLQLDRRSVSLALRVIRLDHRGQLGLCRFVWNRPR